MENNRLYTILTLLLLIVYRPAFSQKAKNNFAYGLDISLNTAWLNTPFRDNSGYTKTTQKYYNPGYSVGVFGRRYFFKNQRAEIESGVLFEKSIVSDKWVLNIDETTYQSRVSDSYLIIPLNIKGTLLKHLKIGVGLRYHFLIDFKNQYTVPHYTKINDSTLIRTYVSNFINKKSNGADRMYNNYTLAYYSPSLSLHYDLMIGYSFRLYDRVYMEPYLKYTSQFIQARQIDYLTIHSYSARLKSFIFGLKISKG